MSPRKVDPDVAKAKQRKQRIALGVGGALLLVIMVMQVPKLMGGGSSSAAEPAADGSAPATSAAPPDATAPAGSSAPAGTTAPATTPAAAPAAKPAATITVAGVQVWIPREPAADRGQGHLVSFATFEVKDPFVPEVVDPATLQGGSDAKQPARKDEKPLVEAAPLEEKPKPDVEVEKLPGGGLVAREGDDDPSTSGGSNGSAGAGKPEKAPPPPDPTNATVSVNGVSYQLEVGQPFPQDDPMFVLFALEPGLAKIKVAGGGAFTSGKPAVIKRNGKLTFVNVATGARYEVELLYLGQEPEQIETFTSGAPAPADAKTGEQATATPPATP